VDHQHQEGEGMSDIVERLRHCSENCGDDYLHELAGRAASEIERLRAALREVEYLDRPQVRGLPRRVSIQEIATAALA
jgi:hypothetical protein